MLTETMEEAERLYLIPGHLGSASAHHGGSTSGVGLMPEATAGPGPSRLRGRARGEGAPGGTCCLLNPGNRGPAIRISEAIE